MVWPSAGAASAASEPITPPEPPRFSTTTGWPGPSDIVWAQMRATRSAAPPGAKGTTIRSGRLGYGASGPACAAAIPGAPRASAAAKARSRSRRMDILPWSAHPSPRQCARGRGRGRGDRGAPAPDPRGAAGGGGDPRRGPARARGGGLGAGDRPQRLRLDPRHPAGREPGADGADAGRPDGPHPRRDAAGDAHGRGDGRAEPGPGDRPRRRRRRRALPRRRQALGVRPGVPEAVAHIAGAHSGEGELVVRSLEGTIVHLADIGYWTMALAGGLIRPETVSAKYRRPITL